MKEYTATITLTIFGNSDEDAVTKSEKLCNEIHRKHGYNPEIERIEERKFYGLLNRTLRFIRQSELKIKQKFNKSLQEY